MTTSRLVPHTSGATKLPVKANNSDGSPFAIKSSKVTVIESSISPIASKHNSNKTVPSGKVRKPAILANATVIKSSPFALTASLANI